MEPFTVKVVRVKVQAGQRALQLGPASSLLQPQPFLRKRQLGGMPLAQAPVGIGPPGYSLQWLDKWLEAFNFHLII